MTYTDQIGDTSDNVVSLLLEAPADTLIDPEAALDINIGIYDEQDQIIGADQIVEALNIDGGSLVRSISSKPDLPFKSGTIYGEFRRDLFPFPEVAPAGSSGVRSLGFNIYKTPAPLSALGATAAFGFTRKLRRRIQAAG